MKTIFTHLFWLFCAYQLFAQVDFDDAQKTFTPKIDSSFVQKRTFDASKLKEYQSSDDFVYEVKEKEPGILQRFWMWLKTAVKNLLSNLFDDINPALGVLRFLLQIIPYVILALGLYFIVKYFTNVSSKSIVEGKNEMLANFTNDEELLQREDLQELLSSAINKKNYRLAIRFYYLITLKKLRELEIIRWQQQKTNEDYIKELANKTYQSEFIQSTKLYNFVWYGKFEIKEKEFEKAQDTFQKLTQKIG